ncbi:RagB/SusD family nutrient uptake outer membrane protein [Chitinophaga japonensis]|uniref:Putative outer membrane starch-binding protein n=1 Tax=Chitinophaga japonensis TaxID=104662 RepID=A0A562T832_CHIJA|nr:RagB/SusD family nutrient uptake outer membrane protein [Chitinophaga japonensis]TWI89338.1 putative outer membrane starch-binding protein [Chitinophaga japonensis]
MYTRNILQLGCLIALLITGCKSSFLDKYPLDQPAEDNFWKSEDDLQLALTGCYASLSVNQSQSVTEGFGAFTMYWDGISDNAYPRSTSFNNIALGQLEPTTGGIVNDWYNLNYRAIASCNYFLANADRVPVDAATLQQYKAEVHFLRAYFYFQLANIYGGVIITLQPEGLDYARDLQKSPQAEVMEQVLNDLDTAIAHLPDAPYSGRAVKASAQGLKARVLLYNDRFREAAATAKAVIDGGLFHLADEYYSLFVKPGQNNNPEIIFSARYLLPNMFSTLDYQMGWDQWERIQPIKNLVDAFECTDGKPITESPLYDTAHPYENRDPRLRKTVYVPGDPWKYSPDGIFDPAKDGNNRTGFLVKKYLDTSRAPTNYSTRSDQDFVLLRYADILLMYAEAQNETSGPDQGVYDAVNAVRARQGINMPPLPAGLSQTEMRQRIRRERRVEFALEGTRYFDLLRWRIAKETLTAIINPGGEPRKFTDRNYLWPFPQSEVDVYGIEQNPGY